MNWLMHKELGIFSSMTLVVDVLLGMYELITIYCKWVMILFVYFTTLILLIYLRVNLVSMSYLIVVVLMALVLMVKHILHKAQRTFSHPGTTV